VSAVLAHVAVGTETSGSLIAPATANGIVALKPTKGIVPTEGIIPLIAHNDTAGPMGRSVADVAALYAVLGATPAIAADRFSISAFDGVTAGLLAADIASDPAHADVLVRATSTLTALGARLRPAELTDPTGQIPMLALVIGSGLRFEVVPYIRALHPDITTLEDLIRWNAAAPATRIPFGQTLLEELAQISTLMTATDHAQATTDLEAAAIAGLEQAFAAASAEVLVSTDSLHAPFYATAGWPAVTVPLGLNGQGQPIGITLIGRKGTDTRLLALAWAIERASRARVVPPMAE
jgi:amidase